MTFVAKKSLGQNFLIDNKVIKNIVELGKIERNDFILEVGAGTGNLTEKILEQSPKKLFVIEKDQRLALYLNEKFGDKINIFNEDMMKFEYEKYFNDKLIIFGNLPYNISTQILAKWISAKNLDSFCKKFILMFQKEVADRIIAETNTKNYGRLSILSNWKMKINKIIDIEPGCFKPVPKVKSTLLVFTPKKKYYNLKDIKNLEHVTNIFFSNRRKMIKKPLRFLFKDFEKVSKKLSLDLSLRPQNLDCNMFYRISELFEKSIN